MDSPRFLACLGLSVAGITGVVFYLLLQKKDDEENKGIRTTRRTVIKVKVPNEFIGTIIGRGGSTVRSIQEKTGARVKCNDVSATSDYHLFTIEGAPESAQLAESMIHEIIMNQPLVISHEMWVPTRACGRIIGRGGETIRLISRTSCAKIQVDSTGDDDRGQTRVLLKGTTEQLALAEALINEKVQEENDFHSRVEVSLANRSPRREPKSNFNYLMAPSNDEDNDLQCPHRTEKFDCAGSEGFFDVFVSAFENPGHFWVQLVSQRGVELDQLVDTMTDYYTRSENKEVHALKEISIGQIVAAPFDEDDKWYRAEVLEIEEDEYDSAESKVTLYYGDYGDSCIVKRKNLLDLRTDYLSLYFQAIECTLAHVKPRYEDWSAEASDCFQELAHVALWQKKLAHVVTYREGSQKEGQRAGNPIPVIELHDMEKKLNIGEELVKQGFAVWDSTQDTDESPSNGTEVPKSSTSTSDKSAYQKLANNPSQKFKTGDMRKENSTDHRTPLAFSESATCASGSKAKLESESVAFIDKKKDQEAGGGFRPKTLKPLKKKQPPPSNTTRAVFLPESMSSDEDDFVLE